MLFTLSACIYVNSGPPVVEEKRFELDGSVDRVELDVSSGHVSLVAGEALVVDRTAIWQGEAPAMSVEVVGSTLLVFADCPGLGLECGVDHDISIPAGITVSGGVGSGDLWLAGLAATAELETGSGDIGVDGHTGSLVITTGSGEADLRGLEADVLTVETGSGDQVVELATVPRSVTISAGSGDVDVHLPSQGPYDLHAESGSGRVTIQDVEVQTGADASVFVATGSGDVLVRGY